MSLGWLMCLAKIRGLQPGRWRCGYEICRRLRYGSECASISRLYLDSYYILSPSPSFLRFLGELHLLFVGLEHPNYPYGGRRVNSLQSAALAQVVLPRTAKDTPSGRCSRPDALGKIAHANRASRNSAPKETVCRPVLWYSLRCYSESPTTFT